MSMSNDELRKYFFDEDDKVSLLLMGGDRNPSQISYLRKGIGSSPNQTSGRSWAKLDLKLEPGPEKGLGLCISRSFMPTSSVDWLYPDQPETHFFSIAGNINPEALYQHLSKLRGNCSLHLLLLVFGPTESPTHSQTDPVPPGYGILSSTKVSSCANP